VIAYKFLGAGAIGLFSGFRWPTPGAGRPGPWVAAEGRIVLGSNGIHSCATTSLLDWIDDELWTVELGGEVLETDGVIVARKGRLLGLLEEWDAVMAASFATGCALAARDYAAAALRRAGRAEDSDTIVAMDDPDTLQASVLALAPAPEGFTKEAVAFLADAIELLGGGRPDSYGNRRAPSARPTPGAIASNLGFVVAHLAGVDAADVDGHSGGYDAGYAAERSRQLAWLAERLPLDAHA
jgi:hypothetical protein